MSIFDHGSGPHPELRPLVAMMGSFALLLAVAVLIQQSPQSNGSLANADSSLAAATALGDAQGVPPGYTGQTYPDDPVCWINYSPEYGPPDGPQCPSSRHRTFYSGVFSIDPGAGGQSAYLTSTYVAAGQHQGPNLGAASSVLFDCSQYSLPAKYSSAAGDYVGIYYDDADNQASCFVYQKNKQMYSNAYLGQAAPISPYDCKQYPPPSGYSLSKGDYVAALDSGDAVPQCFAYHKGGGGQVYVGYSVYNPYSCTAYAVPAGYDYVDAVPAGNGGECYAYKTEASHLDSAITKVGDSIIVAPGASLSLQWSCLRARTVNYESKVGQGWFSDGTWTRGVDYSISPLSTGSTGTGPGTSFDIDRGRVGAKTITAPTQNGTYTYTLTCDSSWALPTMSIAVAVSDKKTVGQPQVSITGNGKTGTVKVGAGDTVHIAATFAADASDNLLFSAINDGSNNALTPWGAPLGQKTYDYTAEPGEHTFYPALQTSLFPAWNNYGQKLVVDASCPDGTDLKGGECVPNVCTEPYQVPNSSPPPQCVCDTFYHDNGTGACVLNQCTGAREDNATYPTCDCESGYQRDDSGVCTPVPPGLSLSASPTRVRSGNSTTLSWSAGPLAEDGSEICSITSNPSGILSLQSDGASATWQGSQSVGPIASQTVFTLSCPGASPVSITVGLIPTEIEI